MAEIDYIRSLQITQGLFFFFFKVTLSIREGVKGYLLSFLFIYFWAACGILVPLPGMGESVPPSRK